MIDLRELPVAAQPCQAGAPAQSPVTAAPSVSRSDAALDLERRNSATVMDAVCRLKLGALSRIR
jgi:hypothetical protein